MGELALKVVTGDVEFLLEKNDIGSQYGCVLAVSQSGSVLSSGLKVGALIVSVGGIPLSGLNREELRTLINDSTNSGELKLKIMDNEGERYCSFPLETSDKEICQTVDKDTELKPDRLELENLRIIHKQAYRSSPDSVRSQHNSQNTSVDTRGPQINFKPKHSSVCPAVTDSYGSHLGAVAKLAIDGGLTTDQLLQIGSSDINQPGHYLYQSSINCDQKCVAPDLKYSSSDPRDAKFLTAHSSAPYSQICRISPGGNRRPVLHSSSQSVQFVRSPGISATHNQSRVTISPNHPTPGYHRSSQWCTPRDNPSTWSMSAVITVFPSPLK
ncbi:unnamed protein product [Heterobilharzia americana]|nr:unnamed protein product [Heterobilharzia americana]